MMTSVSINTGTWSSQIQMHPSIHINHTPSFLLADFINNKDSSSSSRAVLKSWWKINLLLIVTSEWRIRSAYSSFRPYFLLFFFCSKVLGLLPIFLRCFAIASCFLFSSSMCSMTFFAFVSPFVVCFILFTIASLGTLWSQIDREWGVWALCYVLRRMEYKSLHMYKYFIYPWFCISFTNLLVYSSASGIFFFLLDAWLWTQLANNSHTRNSAMKGNL